MITVIPENRNDLVPPILNQKKVDSVEEQQPQNYDSATTTLLKTETIAEDISTYSKLQNPIERLYKDRDKLISRRNKMLSLPFL